MRLMIAALLALALCACASTPNAEYRAYLEASAASEAREAAQLADLKATATACVDDTCRVAIAAIAGFAAQGVAGRSRPAPFVQQPSTAAKIGLALVGQLGPLANAAVSWHQSDNAARTSEAQYRFLGGAVSDMAAVASGATTAAASLVPSVTVGGDYIAGDGNATHGAQIGDSSAVDVGRDQTGGDHADGSVIGDENRFESPGPIDQSNDGDDCTGDSCQAPVPDEDG